MGVTIREKPKGSGIWWAFISNNGNRRSKRIGTDRKLALEVAEKLRAKLALGEVGIVEKKQSIPSFKTYSEKWLEDYIKKVRSESTHKRYQEVLKIHVNPFIGNVRIDELRRGEVRDFFLKLKGNGTSVSTIRTIRNVISGTLNYAVDDELIQANPVVGITRRLQLQSKKSKIESFTAEEVRILLDACQVHYPEFYPFFLCAFRTGMRLGELLALKWGDIDWNGRFIRVSRSYKLGRLTPTKTGKNRRVDMSDQLMAVFRELLTLRKKQAIKQGNLALVEFIFHRTGKLIEQNTARDVFKRVLRKAGLRESHPHECRHTFASLLLTAGESPVYVKEQLGHESIQMTVDIYGHLIPGANRQAVNRLDSVAPSLHPEKMEQR